MVRTIILKRTLIWKIIFMYDDRFFLPNSIVLTCSASIYMHIVNETYKKNTQFLTRKATYLIKIQ